MFCPVSLTAEAEPEPYRYIIKENVLPAKTAGKTFFRSIFAL